MSNPLQMLEEVLALLKIEKEEDFEQYKQYVQQLSLSEKREKGYTWYPVQIVKSGYTIGERAFVIVEKHPQEAEQNHLFRSGKVVSLFTRLENNRPLDKTGVIHYVKKNRMKIILNSKDLPDWLDGGSIGVDLLFDERSYLEMEKALKAVIAAKGNRLAELRDVILGHLPPNSDMDLTKVDLPRLNSAQKQAVAHIQSDRDISVIHGPPGTGKTTTLIQAIRLTAQREAVVLVTAPSNTAVDLLTEKIAAEGLEVVRIGNISRVDDDLLQHTLEMKLARHPESKNIKKIKIKAAEYRKLARQFKRNFGKKEYEQRRLMKREARELSDWANQLEERLIDQILHGASVITSTLVGSSQSLLDRLKFGTVFIDEAAQALEPATWIPILRARQVVLAGDPFQLPPTVKSSRALRQGFNKTLIEKCLDILPRVNFLNIQYRMNEQIMAFSNRQFYDNQLKAAAEVHDWRLEVPGQKPVSFIDTAGCSFDEQINPAYQSRFNPDEYNILREHLYALLDKMDGQMTPSIGLISPYRQQAMYLQQSVSEDARLAGLPISVSTIDGFQGQERDLIYISLVRSNPKGEIGFLHDHRRMNVAMTRARKALIVIGDSSTIGQHEFYADFIRYCEEREFYRSAWEFMQ